MDYLSDFTSIYNRLINSGIDKGSAAIAAAQIQNNMILGKTFGYKKMDNAPNIRDLINRISQK